MSRRMWATIEPLQFDQWKVAGPWEVLIVERGHDEASAFWRVRLEKSPPTEGLSRHDRFERGLSDAYSRAMGFTR
jgi:hypothetical protein